MRILLLTNADGEDSTSIPKFKQLVSECFESVIDRDISFIHKGVCDIREYMYMDHSMAKPARRVSLPGIEFVIVYGTIDSYMPWSEDGFDLLALISECLRTRIPCFLVNLGFYSLVHLFSTGTTQTAYPPECYMQSSTGDIFKLSLSSQLERIGNCGIYDSRISCPRKQICNIDPLNPHWITAALPKSFNIFIKPTVLRIATTESLTTLAASRFGPTIIAAGERVIATSFYPSVPEMRIIFRNFAAIPKAKPGDSWIPFPCRVMFFRIPRLQPVLHVHAAQRRVEEQRWDKVTVRKRLHPTVENKLWEALES